MPFTLALSEALTFTDLIEGAHFGGKVGLAIVNHFISKNDLVTLNTSTKKRGITALQEAALNGHVLIVKALLATNGIDVGITNKYGYTPLHSAAAMGHTSVVSAILDDGRINADAVDLEGGNTALHFATSRGHTSTVRAFLPKLKLEEITHKNFAGYPATKYAKHSPDIGALLSAAEQILKAGLTISTPPPSQQTRSQMGLAFFPLANTEPTPASPSISNQHF